MHNALRIVLRAVIVVVGVSLAAFYVLLFAIADCGGDCQARGERAAVYALVGAGVGLAVFGVLMGKGAARAAFSALAAGGLACSGWSVIALIGGEGGWVWASAGAGAAAFVAGVWGLRAKR